MQLIKKEIQIKWKISYKGHEYIRRTDYGEIEWLYEFYDKIYYLESRLQEYRGITIEELEIEFQKMIRKQKLERIISKEI